MKSDAYSDRPLVLKISWQCILDTLINTTKIGVALLWSSDESLSIANMFLSDKLHQE